MKSVSIAAALSLLALSSCSPKSGGWEDLLDEDLSKWRVYQSYALTDEYVPGHPPVDSLGEVIPPIGYDVNLGEDFSIEELDGEKVLHIGGRYYGCLFTKESLGNYHFRLKVKFGDDKFEPRKNKARDSGIMYHSTGECGHDGWLTWMRAHEFQVMESGSREGSYGDYYNNLGTHMDIRSDVRMESPSWSIYSYNPYSPYHTMGVSGGGATCGGPDVSDLSAEWTTLDLICFEDKAIHIVDGNVKMVLRGSAMWDGEKDIPLTEGQIQLQSEAAEVYYRDVRIRHIDSIPEEYAHLFDE
ncbi:MAG: DUF1080 domain-containing protein [Bacteroidales bacterium]|nr:DUF1080 domain-containing protein [Bacteroidales bacterium]